MCTECTFRCSMPALFPPGMSKMTLAELKPSLEIGFAVAVPFNAGEWPYLSLYCSNRWPCA